MKLKVLFVHPNNKLTGQEFSLLERMQGLREQSVECELLLPQEGEFGEKVRQSEFNVHFFPLNRLKKIYPFPYIKTVQFIKNLIKNEHYNIVHCSGIYPNQYCLPAARFNKVPVIGQVTTTIYNQYDIKSNYVAKMDLVVTCSLAAKQELAKLADTMNGRIRCVYDGISQNHENISQDKLVQLREEFHIGPEDKVIGQLSEIIPRKGCEYFIDMAATVKKEFPKTKFLIVGKNHQDDYENQLRSQIKERQLENDVMLTGFRKDFYALLQLMDVSVLASLAEGLGRVIVETQYLAKPIVATAVSGNVEAIEDGISGMLVPAKNPQALAEKVLTLLHEPHFANKLGETGRQSATNRFSIETHALSMKKVYEDLLNR